MKKAWRKFILGDLLTRSDETILPAPGIEYREITVRLWGKGVLERGRIKDASVNGRRFIARKNQFIASRIDARSGAMGIVPDDLDGALVTNDFPVFKVNRDRLLPQYMGWLCRTPAFVDLCARASEGSTNRVRLKEQEFLALEIQIPDVDDQRDIISRIDVVQQRLRTVDNLRLEIDRDIASLLAVRFHETLKHAKRLPMQDVAPIIRRDVKVEPQSNYSELGIRSFGKGTFHKPTLSGIDIGSKRIYKIEPGDLLFSNVFAWEGAIAVAKPEDVGRVGSHRFISCVPHGGLTTAEYLRYYFLTEDGMTKIRDASPGGAGRNRTLGLTKLMEIAVPLPSDEIQEQFVKLKDALDGLATKRLDQLALFGALLPSLCNQTLSNKL